ncbi:MAG TPA: ATP-binding protein [Gemmatimonadaceae bacterium]|nr:ATP-binding protein [Gemmatimonadaceae bacterium]
MRLTQRLLLGSLLIIGVLVAFVVVIVDGQLKRRLVDEALIEAGRQARLVGAQWTPMTNADSLARSAGRSLEHRVTLIDSTGLVVGDSEFGTGAVDRLENHANRPEVRDALASGSGTARRRSASSGLDELYAATRTDQGVARVSIDTRALEVTFARARRDVLGAGALSLLLAVVLVTIFSRSVARPVIALRDVARDLAGGDLSRRPPLSAPGEVGELASAIHRLAEQLSARLAALDAEEGLMNNLAESLNEGVLAIDARQQVVRTNQRAQRLLGVGDAPFPLVNLPRDRVLREAVTAALSGTTSESLKTEVNGRELAVTARPLPDGGAVLALFDLTPMRRLETVRRDFVANVSHELRTPLTVIGGFAETLADDDIAADERRRFARMILTNTRRLQRMVDDLLDLSRIESGGWRPNPQETTLATVVDEVLAEERAAVAARPVALTRRIADDATTVWVDPFALRQVLANLVENAVRHTGSGEVEVFSRRTDDGVAVGVRDTGTGIAPDHLERIFERFYRADAGRSREQGGTGLGLAIVRHLVETHRGTVRAESTPGQGTTITTTFPDRPAGEGTAEEHQPS